jgi:hypothetical protein
MTQPLYFPVPSAFHSRAAKSGREEGLTTSVSKAWPAAVRAACRKPTLVADLTGGGAGRFGRGQAKVFKKDGQSTITGPKTLLGVGPGPSRIDDARTAGECAVGSWGLNPESGPNSLKGGERPNNLEFVPISPGSDSAGVSYHQHGVPCNLPHLRLGSRHPTEPNKQK